MKMNVFGTGIFVIFVVSLCIFTGCPTSIDEDSEPQIGGELVFDEPQAYDNREIVNLPSLFRSWRGANVDTSEEWDLRRDELKQILQHYEYGYLPSKEGVVSEVGDITVDAKGNIVPIKVTRDQSTATINTLLTTPAGTPPPGGWPFIMEMGMSFGDSAMSFVTNTPAINAGYAWLVVGVGSIDSGDNENGYYTPRTGVVPTLFEYDWPQGSRAGSGTLQDPASPFVTSNGDLNAPGVLINYAWGVSRVIDAIERDIASSNPKLNLNPQKVAITGMSRWGKTAAVAGAFDERIGVVNPVSSGAGGTAIERFLSQGVTEEQSRINAPISDAAREYYYLKLGDTVAGTQSARAVLISEALTDTSDPSGGGALGGDPGAFTGSLKLSATDNNIRSGYAVVGYGLQADGHNESGQHLTDARWAYGVWFNSRFRQWRNLYPLLNIENRIADNKRGELGYLSTIPFDQHFLTALVAPRGLLLHDGFLSNGTTPESTFFNYLATREAYRLLGVEKRIGIAIYNIPHAQPEREIQDLVAFCNAYFNGGSVPVTFTPDSVETYPFPINDPHSRFDYVKLDWAAPGHESIASQVKKF
jgi:hypothetical protein